MEITKKRDFGAAVFLLLLMGLLYGQTSGFGPGSLSAASPDFFPLLMIGIIAVLSLRLLLSSVSFRKATSERPSLPAGGRPAVNLLPFFTVALLGLYIALLPVLTYIPATFLFLFTGMSVLAGKRDARSLAVYFGISGVTTGVLYFIFARLLQLFLP